MQQQVEATAALVQLADQLGVAVTELWRVARSMPVYRAMGMVPWALATGIPSAVLLRSYFREVRRAKMVHHSYAHSTARDIEEQTLLAGAFGLVLGVLSVIFATIAASHLVGLLNQDAYALEYILNRLDQ